ncbi:hybrid sensor histidine kinase/response regulator [Oceaniovalibus guishaninsula]|uniref:hybrid sensor histidine kinase/response regulator n=1 Tax=Oceaniovalibus guishaninsula TaxID=1046117 RepID=UPI0006892F4A|nr:PAS-domain containing protein [Oceaniovalibus guishaninsula]
MSHQLARERRARLAAERMLEHRRSDHDREAARLDRHVRQVTEQVLEKRAEMVALQAQIEQLRDERDQVRRMLSDKVRSAAVSEERLWQALQTFRDGFALFGPDHRLILANDAYLSVFGGLARVQPGISYDELCALIVETGMVDPQGPAEDWIAGMRARWHASPVPSQTICLWNGQFVKLIDRPTPDGGMVTLGVNQTDILRIRAAAEMLPDGFIVFDRDDRVVMCNDNYLKMYPLIAPVVRPGARFEDILRHGIAQGQYDDAIGNEDAWLTQQIARHRDGNGHASEIRLNDGRWIRVLESETPDGGRVGLRMDITAAKRQQADLERARQAAEAASMAKSTFLANMSHELRTPLNGVLGMAEMVLETPLDDEQRVSVEMIRSSAGALLTILEDILDFSRIEAGRLRLRPVRFDLETAVHDTVLLLALQAQAKGIGVVVDYDIFLPTGFIGDGDRLRQILVNLVGNAIKFTDDGHVIVRVTGREGDVADTMEVTIAVEDTGIGIPAEKAEHIFGEFNQVEENQNRAYAGTGLGLAICRRLIDLMGGRIWVETDLPRGSCFGVSLTMAVDPEGDPVPAVLHRRGARVRVVGSPGIVRDSLVHRLEQLGARCFTTATPSEGMEDAVPTVVFDACLPADAEDRARWIGELGEGRLILLRDGMRTGMDRDDYATRFGAVLTAPLRRQQLLDLVESAVIPEAAVPALPAAPRDDDGPLRVLAAEDNKTNQLVLTKMLQGQPIALTMVGDGAAAVASFAEAPPHLILMDISMPGMDGKTAATEIRRIEADGGLARTPIVAMTAHAMAGDAESILAAGIDQYMTKPLSKAALVACIAEAIAGRADRAAPAAAPH